ncbi:PucR family transcriptional regulator [Clostridium sp. 29_15]|uniref:PucR family transcriptional regulator n=1 Tax=Clostridium sp. 29_15 TaxID=1896982 RepID=UPI000B0A101D|nr:helix-turn-helix domain-containing protein [Clostridium sp. 29_15]
MECIENMVKNIYECCNIPFRLSIESLGVYETLEYDDSDQIVSKSIKFNGTECCLKTKAAFGSTLNLLAYSLENKLKDILIHKESIVTSLLEGKNIEKDIISAVWPALLDKFYLIDIYIESKLYDAYLYIKELYHDSDIEVILINDKLLLIAEVKEIYEHIIGIKDALLNNFTSRYYISYCQIENYEALKKSFEECEYKLMLANKYKVSESVINEKKLILEGIIDSVSEEKKEKIYHIFNEGFSKLDNEMIRTIEVFFRCGLNLSDAAKELYIHRNTLIYRLDKIEKYTAYDIRNFNSAVLFKVVFFIWKEKNNIIFENSLKR